MATLEFREEKELILLFISGFILLFVIPFHLLLILVLIKHRNNENFIFPFFRMMISLSVNDVITCLIVSFCYLTLSMGTETVVAYMPVFHCTLLSATVYGGMAGDMIILMAMGVNRLICYVFPLQAHTIWRPIHTRLSIVFQWLYACAICWTASQQDAQKHWFINETSDTLWQVEPESTFYYRVVFVDIVGKFIGGMTLAIIYGICVGKLVHHKITNTAADDSLLVEVRLAFQGAFLSSSLIFMEVMFAALILTGATFSFSVYIVFMAVFLSNFVLGPFIIISMSSEMRKHIKLLFTNDNAVHAL